MIPCTKVDVQNKLLHLQHFPDRTLYYQEAAPKISADCLPFNAIDKKTGKVFKVFVQGIELQRIGVSLTVWKKFRCVPEKLPSLIQNSAQMHGLLSRAAKVAEKLLSPEAFKFFLDIPFANRVISLSLFERVSHTPKIKGVPGIYFHQAGPQLFIFINLKGTPPVGVGSNGKVRRVLWITSADDRLISIVKKVPKDPTNKAHLQHFKNELTSLQEFSSKRGIISYIAGGSFGDKCAIFLPGYQYDLLSFLRARPYVLSLEEALSMISQLLEGLATIAEKGIHGDITLRNLLFKREDGKVEAVISDLSTFRKFGKEQYGLTTPIFRAPEYVTRHIVTSKQDVWAMGLSLCEFFSSQWLPIWKLKKMDDILIWVSELKPNWFLKHPTFPGTPKFLIDLFNAMVDPRPEHRPSAKAAFEQFSKGLSARKR